MIKLERKDEYELTIKSDKPIYALSDDNVCMVAEKKVKSFSVNFK